MQARDGQRTAGDLSRLCRHDDQLGDRIDHGAAGLDLLTRELVLIASCVTMGRAMPQFRAHAEAALKVGATKEQIFETVLQLTCYAGGPAVRNSPVLLQDVFAQTRAS
jgi:alkylhydroperoxidase/carboxymuconolactone decarboxylase family protein YurZ